MKYIMIERELENNMIERIPVIFPNGLVHSDIAKAVSDVLETMHSNPKSKVVSAGFVSFSNVKVGGSSETLNLESNLADMVTIPMIDYFPVVEKTGV